jgi:ribosomal protein L30
MAKLRITYVKSAIGYSQDQKDTIRSLGLRKLNSTAFHADTPSIRGMAFKVRHLVSVEEVADDAAATPRARSARPTVRATFAPAQPAAAKPAKPAAPEQPVAAPAEPAKPAEPAADDLEVVEGIGPKIAGVLKDAGIGTLAQLAATDVERLREILHEGEIRIGDPTTWPEQAALAAEGKWDEFNALTEQLKGGRRVS